LHIVAFVFARHLSPDLRTENVNKMFAIKKIK